MPGIQSATRTGPAWAALSGRTSLKYGHLPPHGFKLQRTDEIVRELRLRQTWVDVADTAGNHPARSAAYGC